MFRLTEIVKHLVVINVLMFVGTMLMGQPSNNLSLELINLIRDDFSSWQRYTLAMFYPGSPYFRPYQLVTHMFMHADLGHLFFNMFALAMFGPHLENLWGGKRFLFFYLFTGFGSVLLHMLVRYLEIEFGASPMIGNVPSLGASGAVFGVLAGYGMKFPEHRVMLIFPPIPMKARTMVILFAALELFMGLGPFQTGVAHFAHLGGALFGLLLILYWNKYGSRL
jgi:membrane associated rhomboid family serine protease